MAARRVALSRRARTRACVCQEAGKGGTGSGGASRALTVSKPSLARRRKRIGALIGGGSERRSGRVNDDDERRRSDGGVRNGVGRRGWSGVTLGLSPPQKEAHVRERSTPGRLRGWLASAVEARKARPPMIGTPAEDMTRATDARARPAGDTPVSSAVHT